MLLIEDLHTLKEYKPETLYVAASIVDHYIIQLPFDSELPDLIELGVTSLFIAAKIEEPKEPTVKNIIRLLEDRHDLKVTR